MAGVETDDANRVTMTMRADLEFERDAELYEDCYLDLACGAVNDDRADGMTTDELGAYEEYR